MSNIAATEQIERQILLFRGHKVLLDVHLAALYSVKCLNEQVRRNHTRFPDDFMFQLMQDEVEALRSQIATSKGGRGGRSPRSTSCPSKLERMTVFKGD